MQMGWNMGWDGTPSPSPPPPPPRVMTASSSADDPSQINLHLNINYSRSLGLWTGITQRGRARGDQIGTNDHAAPVA